MSTEISQHFFNEVYPSYVDYTLVKKQLTSGDDLRLCKNAAGLIYHFREMLPPPFNDKKHVDTICPDFHILSEAVNAGKHHKRQNPEKALILSSNDIRLIILNTNYNDVLGPYYHEEKEVSLFLKDDSMRDLYEVMTNVLNFWFVLLAQLDLAPYMPPIDIKRTGLITREQAKKVDIKKDLTYYTPIIKESRNQTYNYITRQVEHLPASEEQIAYMRVEMTKAGTVNVIVHATSAVNVRIQQVS